MCTIRNIISTRGYKKKKSQSFVGSAAVQSRDTIRLEITPAHDRANLCGQWSRKSLID